MPLKPKRITTWISGDLKIDLDVILKEIKSHGVPAKQGDLVRIGLSVIIKKLLPAMEGQRFYSLTDVENALFSELGCGSSPETPPATVKARSRPARPRE